MAFKCFYEVLYVFDTLVSLKQFPWFEVYEIAGIDILFTLYDSKFTELL